LFSSSCLVLDTPEAVPAERGRPQILPITPTGEFLRVVRTATTTSPLSLSFQVVSEDLGEPLVPVLLVDYGVEGPGGEPWQDDQQQSVIDAGTLAQGARTESATWNPSVELGCHTVTLLVTHQPTEQNPFYWCPLDPNDVDTITWFTTICQDTTDACTYDECPINGEGPFNYCNGDDGSDIQEVMP
jgi:hypothetical protein